MNPPDNLPPLSRQREILTWAFDQFGPDGDFDKAADKRMFNSLESWLMELESVREPAEEEPPFPGAQLDSLEGLENLRHYEGKAFTKSFTVGWSEPANEPAAGELPPPVDPAVILERIRAKLPLLEPTGVDSIATREWCVKSAEIEGEAEIGAGTPTGVEARVCADIAKRQRLGIAKYGVTVEQSPDNMLRHAYEEALDLSVYLKAVLEWQRVGWMPIETAPKDGTPILVWNRKAPVAARWGYSSDGDYNNPRWEPLFAGALWRDSVTHWQPLPPPPAERSDHE